MTHELVHEVLGHTDNGDRLVSTVLFGENVLYVPQSRGLCSPLDACASIVEGLSETLNGPPGDPCVAPNRVWAAGTCFVWPVRRA